MLIIAIAVLVSSVLGIASYYFEKLFYGMLIASLPIAFVFFKIILFAPQVGPSAQAGSNNRLMVFVDIFEAIPQHGQTAILVLPVCFFACRLVTWIYNIAIVPEPVVESKASRKQRILESYGMSDD